LRKCFLLLLLAGCAVGPNYRPPQPQVPETWNLVPCGTDEKLSCAPSPCDWWNVFHECLLNKYIHLGAKHNNNVLAAEYNILNARSLHLVSSSKLFPQLDADFNALRAKLSESGPFGLLAEGEARRQMPLYFSLYSAFLDASWEVDLFGKTRRGMEAACAAVGMAVEDRNDLLLSIFGEIARNYFEVRSYQHQILLTEKNIALLERNRNVVREQLIVGYRNRLDLERVEAELANARSTLPDLIGNVYRGIYALSMLTGQMPEALVIEMLPICPLPEAPLCIDVGIRSEILRRRPDVRRAERQLAQATANIGVAVAGYYPSVKLYALAGFSTGSFRDLFTSKSFSWILDGNVGQPIFHGGSLLGNLRSAQAKKCQALYLYQQAVVEAIAEAQSDFVAYAEEVVTSKELAEVVAKNQSIMELNQARLNIGLVSITDLLDVERQLIASELNFVSSRTQALLDLVALYKSLGGGWECPCN
jgi:multidrug efflux system outer membrane protein